MRIKEFFIKRYGPLQEIGYELSHHFTLLAGNNEAGKTLTIDALVRLLLGKQVKGFEGIDRVAETPEGYCVIDDSGGTELKLPEKSTFTDVTGITASECRNIFIIRDSDVSIASEGEFFTYVTDRLTGLRTREISAIKKELQDIGRLTRPDSNAALSDREEYEKIKSRIEDAVAMLELIDEVEQLMQKERYDELEEEVASLREGVGRIEKALEDLEQARKREQYEKGVAALKALRDALGKINELRSYNEADSQAWRDCDRDIRIFTEARDKLGAQLKEMKKKLMEIEERLGMKKGEFDILERRKKKLDDAKADLNLYERKRTELAQKEQKKAWWFRALIVSVLLFCISLFGLIARPSVPFYIAAPLFLIAAAVFFTLQLQLVRDQSWLAGSLERIKLMLAKFQLGAETIEAINAGIQQFEEEHRRKLEEIQELMRREENLAERVAEIQHKMIPGQEQKIGEAEEKIDQIRKRSRAEYREDYDKELALKQHYEKSVGEQRSILESHLGTKDESWEQAVVYWDRELQSLAGYRDKAREIQYDERVVSTLQGDKNAAVKKLDDLNEWMVATGRQLGEIERRANGIIRREEDYLHCDTSIDLKAIKGTVRKFIKENEGRKDDALKVMAIFEAIELEKKERVAEQFGHGSAVARYFADITDGLYEEVTFDQERGIEVRRRDGILLPADKLSGGAYDQLYLSIRLALAEKVLEGKKGFFIMDDPFVKADPARLHKQLEVLQKISRAGWQVIYFTAKGEIREALKQPIRSGKVQYVEIPGIFV
jgi:DNA repair exonuclease SbcCD ATPase subunit